MKGMQLPEAQLEIMKIIWANGGSIMFSQLAAELQNRQSSWKTNTVLTFLARLVDKKMLKVRKQGRLNEYIALVSEQAYMEEETRSFINKVYGGKAKNLVTALLKKDYLTDKDYEELEVFWNGGKGKNE